MNNVISLFSHTSSLYGKPHQNTITIVVTTTIVDFSTNARALGYPQWSVHIENDGENTVMVTTRMIWICHGMIETKQGERSRLDPIKLQPFQCCG